MYTYIQSDINLHACIPMYVHILNHANRVCVRACVCVCVCVRVCVCAQEAVTEYCLPCRSHDSATSHDLYYYNNTRQDGR